DEALAELAGDDDENRIAGAQDVGESRFHHRRAGAGEGQNVMRRAEDRLQALLAFRQHGPELGAAVVEDRQRGGLADAFGDGSRAGKAEPIIGNGQHGAGRLAEYKQDRQLQHTRSAYASWRETRRKTLQAAALTTRANHSDHISVRPREHT